MIPNWLDIGRNNLKAGTVLEFKGRVFETLTDVPAAYCDRPPEGSAAQYYRLFELADMLCGNCFWYRGGFCNYYPPSLEQVTLNTDNFCSKHKLNMRNPQL